MIASGSTVRPAMHLRRTLSQHSQHAHRFLQILAGMSGVALALTLAVPAQAEKADHDRPMNVTSDNWTLDDLKQVHVFIGNVTVTRGTMIIRSDQLNVHQDPEGYQYATATASSPSKLVYFRQKREGLDEFIEGQAERVEYDEKADKVKLINQASIRRLSGATSADEIHGSMIDYDNRTEYYTAHSGVETGGPQVRVIIQPHAKAPAGVAPAAPAAVLDLAPSDALHAPPKN